MKTLKAVVALTLMAVGFNAAADKLDSSTLVAMNRISPPRSPAPVPNYVIVNPINPVGPIQPVGPIHPILPIKPSPNFVLAPGNRF